MSIRSIFFFRFLKYDTAAAIIAAKNSICITAQAN